MLTHGEMSCAACGWWPPVTRVKKGKAEPATDRWRWRELLLHVIDTSRIELDEDPHYGHSRPHNLIVKALEETGALNKYQVLDNNL